MNLTSIRSKTTENINKVTHAKMLLNLVLCVILSKESHKISVATCVINEKRTTERNILCGLASLYDPIDLIASTLFIRKLMQRNLCDLKMSSDEVVSMSIETKCENWNLDIRDISGYIRIYLFYLDMSKLAWSIWYVFWDASIVDFCATVHKAVSQSASVN